VIAVVAISATATLLGAGLVLRIRGCWGRASRLLLLVTFPLTAGALALGPEALRLAYGDEYEGTRAILVILLLPFPLIPLMSLATAVLIGLGRLWTPIVTTGVLAPQSVE
jgi:O-antigen/teichoic acid export membrane protein